MKKCMKIICILLIILTIFISFDKIYAAVCNVCYGRGCPKCEGSQLDSHSAGEIVSGGDSFIAIGESTQSPITIGEMQDLSSTIYNILLVVGIIIAFIIGGILGIQFMTGGVEGQVEVKKALVPYILGCVVIFGAFTIWKIVISILQ